jgi:hypothetical protein
VIRLVDDGVFDYLFVLETWYVDHTVRRLDPRVIATTDVPPGPLLPSGHRPGGIMLLGSARSRGWLRGDPTVSGEHAVTIPTCYGRLTGVYLPPSLTPVEVEGVLQTVADSDVVIGDVNVRFEGLTLQHGVPGPSSRLDVFYRWMDANPIAHVMPLPTDSPSLPCEALLNLDHCFVRESTRSHALHLPTTEGLGLKSDHRYALSLTLEGIGGRVLKSTLRLPHYRIRLLDDEARVASVRKAWIRCSGGRRDLLRPTLDIERRNTRIVKMCQRISGMVLGRRPIERRQRSSPPLRSEHSDVCVEEDSGIMGSIRLYKRAARMSRENAPLLPTGEGRRKGLSAIEEVTSDLQVRFTPNSEPPPLDSDSGLDTCNSDTSDLDDNLLVSAEEVVEELRHQDSSKACGMDGIHIRLLKTLAETSFVDVLAVLFNSCIRLGRTPRVWNDSTVCLIVKDHTRPKNADNVRPITLIGMFRKVFERLLLRRFDTTGWARVQPTQAGFRGHHSTCTNAAVLHSLLESRRVTHVVFLDFKAAFDVVDHSLLTDVLRRRGCPPRMLALIASLTFRGVRSRVVSDGEASDWFARSRGVLQGSPLSPCLFNLFVDGLLETLNDGSPPIPRSLFYADDGVLLASSSSEIQRLLDVVVQWSASNRMTLNVKKCGYLTPPDDDTIVYLRGERVPRLDRYVYLGFPVTNVGIDFEGHLTGRLDRALGRAAFLTLHSDRWGPAHRLRVYRQYLAPMFEYGAPLVAAFAEGLSTLWTATIEVTKGLTGWISGYTSSTHLTRSLLGLQPLPDRFADLKTSFQLIVSRATDGSTLRTLASLDWPERSFYRRFTDDSAFRESRVSNGGSTPTVLEAKRSLGSFLRGRRDLALSRELLRRKLTRLIPASSRLKRDMRGADGIFRAPLLYQKQFLQYRRGTFNAYRKCICPASPIFRRGHEVCFRSIDRPWLSRKELRVKVHTERRLGSDVRLTEIDFLLNAGRFHRAYDILRHITKTLAETNSPSEEDRGED